MMIYPATQSPKAACEALFSVPNLLGPFSEPTRIPERCGRLRGEECIAWSAYAVVCDFEGRLAPFGMKCAYFLHEPEDAEADLSAWAYPPHIKRVCAIDPGDFDQRWPTPGIIGLHRVLVDMARQVYRRCPFDRAAIGSEDRCPGFDEGIVVYREVADGAGWRVQRYGKYHAVLSFE
jgi:hypothetical protein